MIVSYREYVSLVWKMQLLGEQNFRLNCANHIGYSSAAARSISCLPASVPLPRLIHQRVPIGLRSIFTVCTVSFPEVQPTLSRRSSTYLKLLSRGEACEMWWCKYYNMSFDEFQGLGFDEISLG